jgi:hypothetical protein
VSTNVFHTPRPSRWLIRPLGWVNSALVLPYLARVRKVHLPEEDSDRLSAALRDPAVICPNHPEFFSDWMLDKWLASRFAPMAANWADPAIVNGMGAAMQRFWLANNLVAAVRGDALDAAIAYSAKCLAAGDAALIHPEGEVNWDNEALGRLRGGCVQIAQRGAAVAGRPAAIVPVAWFIRFCDDATAGLEAELDYVQRKLGFRSSRLGGPAERMADLYSALLEREASRYDIATGRRGQSFLERFDIALEHTLACLGKAWPAHAAALEAQVDARSAWDCAAAWTRYARRQGPEAPTEFRHQTGILDRMLRLLPAHGSNTHLTQEQVGERVKRLRSDWLRGSLRDQISRFLPRAVVRREVFVRVGAPVEIAATGGDAAAIDAHLATLSTRLREAVEAARQDGLKRLGPPVRYLNPFVHPAA